MTNSNRRFEILSHIFEMQFSWFGHASDLPVHWLLCKCYLHSQQLNLAVFSFLILLEFFEHLFVFYSILPILKHIILNGLNTLHKLVKIQAGLESGLHPPTKWRNSFLYCSSPNWVWVIWQLCCSLKCL